MSCDLDAEQRLDDDERSTDGEAVEDGDSSDDGFGLDELKDILKGGVEEKEDFPLIDDDDVVSAPSASDDILGDAGDDMAGVDDIMGGGAGVFGEALGGDEGIEDDDDIVDASDLEEGSIVDDDDDDIDWGDAFAEAGIPLEGDESLGTSGVSGVDRSGPLSMEGVNLGWANVPLELVAEVGSTELSVSELLKVGRGAVVGLDPRANDLIDLKIDNLLVARGEIGVKEDKLIIRIKEKFD